VRMARIRAAEAEETARLDRRAPRARSNPVRVMDSVRAG
jgi:hypothetical protein